MQRGQTSRHIVAGGHVGPAEPGSQDSLHALGQRVAVPEQPTKSPGTDQALQHRQGHGLTTTGTVMTTIAPTFARCEPRGNQRWKRTIR